MANLLQGFDMVAAITQASMNTQAYELFEAKNKDNVDVISKTIDVKQSGAIVDIELKGTLGSSDGGGPWYSFGVPGNQRAIYFHLPIKEGNLNVIGKSTMAIPFTDLEWVFQVNLDFVAIKQGFIQDKNAKIPKVVQDHLNNFDDSMFTVRSLMADFENANIANYEPSKSKIPAVFKTGDLTTLIASAISVYFTQLKDSKNPYILGYVIDSKDANADPALTPTFVPTGSTFSSFLNTANSDLNALNFLLMTGGVEPPGGGAGQFTTDWVTSGTYDGKFVIGEPLLFSGWLIPTIQKALGLGAATKSGDTWTMKSTTDFKDTYKDQIDCKPITHVDLHVHTTGNKSVTVSHSNPSANKAQITISGKIHRRLDNKFQCILVETSWATVDQTFTITATITVGANGQFVFDYKEEIPSPRTDTGSNWVSKMDNAFGGMKGFVSGEVTSLKRAAKGVVDSLETSLQGINARFVSPGGGVFFFKNPQFNNEGDLLADITYKTN